MRGLRGLRGLSIFGGKPGIGAAGSQPNHNAIGSLFGGLSVLAGVGTRAHLSSGGLTGAGGVLTGSASRSVASAGMPIGMNLTTTEYFAGPTPFANLMWGGLIWQKTSDFTYWSSQDQGLVSGAVATDENTAIIASTPWSALPAGTYTWRNPDGCNIAFGTGAAGQDLQAYTTATSGTFTLSANSGLAITAKGNVTNIAGTRAGAIQVILPGHVASWDGGDYFNSAYINFHTNLGTQYLRMMDWMEVNFGVVTDWADRANQTGISMWKKYGGLVALDVMISLSNRLSKPIWITIPVRATDDYCTQLATLLSTTYAHAQVYIEYGNELWNTVFAGSTNWTTFLPHTRFSVTGTAGTFTRVAHGWANNKILRAFEHKQGRDVKMLSTPNTYLQGILGNEVYVTSLTADTFQLWTGPNSTGTQIILPSGISNLILLDPAEVGKETNLDVNYRTRSKQIWDIFDTALGSSRVKTVLAGYFENSSMATARMTGTAGARANYYAVAPYWWGYGMGGRIVRASTQFTPQFWSNDACTVYCGVYAQGSTPRIDQIKAGTGTGFVAMRTWSHVVSGSTRSAGAVIGSLVNGTIYKVCYVAVDSGGYTWSWSQDVSASASADNVEVHDAFANQKYRSLWDIDHPSSTTKNIGVRGPSLVSTIQALNASTELIAYEAGSHESPGTWASPDEITTWFNNWTEDQTYADVLRHYLYQAAASGYKRMTIFRDMYADGGPWALADTNYDTADERYAEIAALGGLATFTTLVDVPNTTAPAIAADPVIYPYTAHTFADATLTYVIISGNDAGNWDFSGASLRLINNTAINWGSATTHTLRVMAHRSGQSFSIFNLSISVGAAGVWYANFTDAQFLFDAVADTNNAAINAVFGSNLALTSGSGASIASGLWDNTATSAYGLSTAMTAAIDRTKPFLVAVVINKDNQSAAPIELMRFGPYPFLSLGQDSGNLDWQWAGPAITNTSYTGSNSTGTKVYWFFYHQTGAKVYYGYNQTEVNPAGGSTPPTSIGEDIPRDITVYASEIKYGSLLVLNRAGLTLAQAKSYVQDMQNRHGI